LLVIVQVYGLNVNWHFNFGSADTENPSPAVTCHNHNNTELTICPRESTQTIVQKVHTL